MKAFSSLTGLGQFFSFVTLALFVSTATRAADVSFYAVDKQQKFIQIDAGSPSQAGVGNPFRINATLSPTTAGSVVSATVKPPSGASQTLVYNPINDAFEFQAKFPTQSALDAAAGPGNYILSVNTLHDGLRTLTLNLPSAAYPGAPHISNFAAAQTINPTADFTLTWDGFAGGTTKDFIYLVGGDSATGQALFQTPGAGNIGALNGTATSFVIPANTLIAGQVYQAELAFYKVLFPLDTTTYPGASGAVAFGSFINFNLSTAANPLLLTFSFRHFANGGSFVGASTNPTVAFPVAVNSYRANFDVQKDVSYPPVTQVFFTGPSGSGLVNAPADAQASVISSDSGSYFSPRLSQPAIAPGGTWLINYKGTTQSFTVPDPQAAARLIVLVPVVTVLNDILESVRWSYWDANGNALGGAPAFLSNIRVQALGAAGVFLYDSGKLPPTMLNHSLTKSVQWSQVLQLRMLYGDSLGDIHVLAFNKVVPTTAIELSAPVYLVDGTFALRLSGDVTHSYLIQSSADLTNWTDLLTTNIPTATVDLIDTQATNFKYRFYRAKLAN